MDNKEWCQEPLHFTAADNHPHNVDHANYDIFDPLQHQDVEYSPAEQQNANQRYQVGEDEDY